MPSTARKRLAAAVLAVAALLAVDPTAQGGRPAAEAGLHDDDAAERAAGRLSRGSLDADRARRALVPRRLEEREAGPHRLRASLRAHDVQGLEERRARRRTRRCISSVGGQSNAYTTEDETVFWQTVPAQYLPLVLWLEADRMATLRIDEKRLPDRARGRQGRAADAGREPAVRPAERDHLRPGVHDASLQAPDDRQHGGSRGGVDRRRARLLPDLLRARRTRRWCWSATSTRRRRCSWSTQYLGRVPKADAAGAARHPEGAAADQGAARDARGERGRCRRWSSRYHITYDGHPDSYPLHIASKVLSDGQSSRIYREAGLREAARAGGVRRRQHHRGSEPVLRGGDRAAGPDAGGGDRGADRRARAAAKPSRSPTHELQQAKNQFARDYILGRESNQEKARAARRTRRSSTTTSRPPTASSTSS